MEAPEPTREHLWLASFAGERRVESHSSMGPDQPHSGPTGRETPRRLGELWIVTEGPSMRGDGSFLRYVDAFEVVNDDERVLSSRMQNPDGSSTPLMRSVCRRVR